MLLQAPCPVGNFCESPSTIALCPSGTFGNQTALTSAQCSGSCPGSSPGSQTCTGNESGSGSGSGQDDAASARRQVKALTAGVAVLAVVLSVAGVTVAALFYRMHKQAVSVKKVGHGASGGTRGATPPSSAPLSPSFLVENVLNRDNHRTSQRSTVTPTAPPLSVGYSMRNVSWPAAELVPPPPSSYDTMAASGAGKVDVSVTPAPLWHGGAAIPPAVPHTVQVVLPSAPGPEWSSTVAYEVVPGNSNVPAARGSGVGPGLL